MDEVPITFFVCHEYRVSELAFEASRVRKRGIREHKQSRCSESKYRVTQAGGRGGLKLSYDLFQASEVVHR